MDPAFNQIPECCFTLNITTSKVSVWILPSATPLCGALCPHHQLILLYEGPNAKDMSSYVTHIWMIRSSHDPFNSFERTKLRIACSFC